MNAQEIIARNESLAQYHERRAAKHAANGSTQRHLENLETARKYRELGEYLARGAA